jgi:hypothetical protein
LGLDMVKVFILALVFFLKKAKDGGVLHWECC